MKRRNIGSILLHGILGSSPIAILIARKLLQQLSEDDIKEIGRRIQRKIIEGEFRFRPNFQLIHTIYDFVGDKLVELGYLTQEEKAKMEILFVDAISGFYVIHTNKEIYEKLKKLYRQTKDKYIKFILKRKIYDFKEEEKEVQNAKG